MKNNIRYKGNDTNNTSVIIFLNRKVKNCQRYPRHFRRWGGLYAHTRKKKKTASDGTLLGRTSDGVFIVVVVVVVVHSILFFISFLIFILLLFFIHCFSTSSLTHSWTIAGFYTHFILSAQHITE